MKRKLFAAILAVTFILSGCGEKEKVITGEKNKETSQALEADNKIDNSANSKKGYVFKTGDIEIEIEAEAKPYIDALGEPKSYYESPSCAFGDLDKIYTYNGFEINTFSTDGKDYVSIIILNDDSVSTKEGIFIGDSADKVKEIYGTDVQKNDNALVYAKGNMKLCFFIKGDVVESIQYLNTILD